MPLPWRPDDLRVAWLGSVATYRTVGNAATTQTLLTIEVPVGSRLARLISIEFDQDMTAALTAVDASVKVSRTTAMPSAGTVLAGVASDTALGASVAVVRGATASDGGAASPITATPVAGPGARAVLMTRLHTAVGQVLSPQTVLLPQSGLVLRGGEAAVVHIVAPSAAANPATNHYVVCAAWEEFAPE